MYISDRTVTESVTRTKEAARVAVYRYQVVSVGWWRGQIKRWNTTFHYSVSNQASSLRDHMQRMGYPNPGDITGDCSGGVASIAVYGSGGGTPISRNTYFDWQTPSTWIPYTGEVWANVDPDTPLDASGESAAVLIGHMAGLSSSGKPVTTRKYFHAIPSRTAVDYADPDIDAATLALIEAEFTVNWLANPAGVQPSSKSADPWYLNHQRVRGRRRTTASVASTAFAAGVVTGAAAGAGTFPDDPGLVSGGGSF